jgi:hypothetical protein
MTHTASTEHRMPVDTAQISDDARFAAMMDETDNDGFPLVAGGSGNDAVSGSLIAVTLGVMAIVIGFTMGFIGLCYWAAGNTPRCLFLMSLIFVAAALAGVMLHKINNGEVKL